MEKAFLSLYLDLTKDAPDGPGWYVGASKDSQPVMAPRAIDPDTALTLSRGFLAALEASQAELPTYTPPAMVLEGNGLIRAALEQQLAYAEEQARKVAMYRRKLTMMTPQTERERTSDA